MRDGEMIGAPRRVEERNRGEVFLYDVPRMYIRFRSVIMCEITGKKERSGVRDL